MLRRNKEIFIIIGFFALIRLIVAPHFGLGVDEAHYVLYAKYLDWSYLDHPPLVGWVHAIFFYTFGTNEFLARLPAILIFAATSYCAYLFMLHISKSVRLSWLTVLALNCSFMFNVLGLMLLPDSLLLLFVFLLIFIAEKINYEKRFIDFIYLGILLGFMGLAKYTAILLVPPLIAYFLLNKRYDIVFSKEMAVAALIALVLVTPVIVWNIEHDFSSFRYQGARVFGSFTKSLKYFTVSLAAQFGTYSPLLFLAALYGFIKFMRSREDYLRLSVLFGGTIIGFFLLTSFSQRALPHWPAIFYLLFIPLGCYALLISKKKWRNNYFYFAVGLSLLLLLLAYTELIGKFIKYPDYKSPFRDIYGFQEISKKADAILKNDENNSEKAIAVTNWTMGSRTIYYTIPYDNKVFVIDSRKDQFDIWEKKLPMGMDLLIINTHFNKLDALKRLSCERVENAEELEIELNGSKVDVVKYVWCRNYGGFSIE
jgi:hypothetical protein